MSPVLHRELPLVFDWKTVDLKVPHFGFDWKKAGNRVLSSSNYTNRFIATWFNLLPADPDAVHRKDEAFDFLDAALAALGEDLCSQTGPFQTINQHPLSVFCNNTVKTKVSQKAITALSVPPIQELVTLLKWNDLWKDIDSSSDYSGLFLTFKDTIPSAQGLLGFANKYGWLGNYYMDYRWSGDLDYLHRWYYEVVGMRRAVEIWDLLKRLKMAKGTSVKVVEKSLSKYFQWQSNNGGIQSLFYDSHSEMDKRDKVKFPECRMRLILATELSPHWPEVKDENALAAAQFFLKEIINWHQINLADSTLVWTDEPEKAPLSKRNYLQPKNMRMTRKMVPRNLLGELWVQLEEAVYGNKDYKLCALEGCGIWFDASSSRPERKYCSDKCKTAAHRDFLERVREKYIKEMARGKLSKEMVIKKIAKEEDIEEERVKGIISN